MEAKPARKVFDIIRNGVFKSPALERLRAQALKLSDPAIAEINAAIQDCTSEAMIEERIRSVCGRCAPCGGTGWRISNWAQGLSYQCNECDGTGFTDRV